MIMSRLLRRLSAVALVGGFLIVGSPAMADPVDITVTVPERADGTFGTVANAQFRWGMNNEASSGAFAGGCNFLSAGEAGNTGGVRVWTASDGFYSANSGNVTVQKPTAAGGWTEASFATKCLDSSGAAVTASSTTSTTQSQVVIEGGTGTVTAEGLSIAWDGSFTVAFYGGMTYWTASDPVLRIDASGNGQVTATASGYGTSMDDMTQWVDLADRTIVLAELRSVPLDGGGFSVVPEYLGVASQTGGQSPKTADNSAYWGAFPASFMDFQVLTGQAGYWQTSGGQRDTAKPATALTVNFDANAPAIVPVAEALPASDGSPDNSSAVRPSTATATGAGAAGVSTPPGAAGGATADTVTVVRDDGSSFLPEALTQGAGRQFLLVGGFTLAALISVLAALQLSGHLVLPWSRGGAQ
jgi:hypothetical protein